MRVAVIEKSTCLVVNVAEISEGDGSQEPDGYLHIQSDTANIGDSWNGSVIVKKPEPPFEPRV